EASRERGPRTTVRLAHVGHVDRCVERLLRVLAVPAPRPDGFSARLPPPRPPTRPEFGYLRAKGTDPRLTYPPRLRPAVGSARSRRRVEAATANAATAHGRLRSDRNPRMRG